MEQICFFHDYSMVLVVMVSVLVFYVFFSVLVSGHFRSYELERHLIELVWTVFPAFMLVFLAIPSMKVLYIIEERVYPLSRFKVIGHQWFWSYEVGNDMEEVDSFIEDSLIFRLLKVSNLVNFPFGVVNRGLISSVDVIHSWTLPSVGVKVDALPGRLNQVLVRSNKASLVVGQCSEICGSNHSFMPIVVLFSSF